MYRQGYFLGKRMRRKQKQQADELLRQMELAHDQIRNCIKQNNIPFAEQLLEDCQYAAVSLGTFIENIEGEGLPTVSLLEEYCELTYQMHENLEDGTGQSNPNEYYKRLKQKLIKISNSIKHDIKLKVEAVFLPYKASMWDSLESVWQAADADPDCDAYVIPIPYYDKDPDGTLRTMHYEAEQFPNGVPITKYNEYDFEEHQPNMVFIHNPYDEANYVTSVHPFFYSDNIKKYTDCLVYIPYYATTGGMAEAQALCPAYINADYIVIQSREIRACFDERIPDSKFLALGSPKFDSVIHKCQNPPALPAEWKEKINGRKVYFYNTSLGGMLANTDVFLKKMRYVFDTFQGREDVCLLWRPHPLMESTFDSLRRAYKPLYDALKKEFVDNCIGILDQTDDIETTIACSDVYIGDSGTSVTSLFGVAGKPMFIFNNYINTLPEKDDWRGERIVLFFDQWGDDRYQVTQNNQLWFSENNDYHYKFYMDLGIGRSGGAYYLRAIEIKDKIYVIPGSAQNMLIIKNKKIRKVDFEKRVERMGAFRGCYYNEKYLFLYPNKYPSLIRYDIETEEILYLDGIQQFNVRNLEGEWRGGIVLYKNELIFASPEDNRFVFMDIDTLETRVLKCDTEVIQGTFAIVVDGDSLWLLPVKGIAVVCWNPETGDIREYTDIPEEFHSIQWPFEYECDEMPFGSAAISKEGDGERIVISPRWGNMYLSLDRETGRMEEWKSPVGTEMRGKNGYYRTDGMGEFVITRPQLGKPDCRIWYAPKRKLYDINIITKAYQEVVIEFDYDDLTAHEPGFMEESEVMPYCLNENAFNSLKDLLDDNITGQRFDRERQLKAFSRVNADTQGTCGRNVYNLVKGEAL